ncbi:MAG: hypothetical protein FJ360_03605 [Thaumarchaeota archaeon]|nr:hypothetical protein [Nitrososphaerota archaeon]
MTRTKEDNFRTKLEKEANFEKIKTAYWSCKAFNFSDVDTLTYINSGLLGYKKDKTPKTISRRTFYEKYKKQFIEPPSIFEDLKKRTTEGYLELLIAIQSIIDTLVEMSGKNLFSKNLNPIQKQSIIDSIITKVLPAKASAANAIKRMMDRQMLVQPEEVKQFEPTRTEDNR